MGYNRKISQYSCWVRNDNVKDFTNLQYANEMLCLNISKSIIIKGVLFSILKLKKIIEMNWWNFHFIQKLIPKEFCKNLIKIVEKNQPLKIQWWGNSRIQRTASCKSIVWWLINNSWVCLTRFLGSYILGESW